MNEIIKNIEAAQLKETVPSFNVGDTVRVSAKIREGNRERIQVFEGTVIKRQNGGVRPSLSERIPTASALKRPGRFILRLLRISKL